MTSTLHGHLGSVSFDGTTVTVSKKMRGESRIPLAQLTSVMIVPAGMGMRGIRFLTASGTTGTVAPVGSHKDVAADPNGLTFRKKHLGEFQALADEVTAAIAARG
jgi:hypothetical protein